MNLIRKAFWPALIAFGFLMILGAIGQSGVRTAQAASGDICRIEGPTVIPVGYTALYVARVEDNNGSVFDASVDLDDIVGDSDITSAGIEDDDFWEYDDGVGPTDFLIEVGIVDIANDLIHSFDGSTFLDDLEDTFGYRLDGDVCGRSRWGAVLLRCITNSDCDEWMYENDGTDSSLGGVGITVLELGAVLDAITDGFGNLVLSPGNPSLCEALGSGAENFMINEGLDEDVASDIVDEIEDLCDGGIGASDGPMDDMIVVDVTCEEAGNFELTFSIEGEGGDAASIAVTCVGDADRNKSTLTAIPTSVEIVPAVGNVAHSLIVLVLLDEDGNQASWGGEVVFQTDRCSIEESAVDTEAEFEAAEEIFRAYRTTQSIGNAAAVEASAAATTAPDSSSRQEDSTTSFSVTSAAGTLRSVAGAVLHCDVDHAPSATPGVATVQAIVDISDGPTFILTAKVTVVGPPATLAVAADQTSVECGGRIQITATVKDAIGQNVSEHTRVEMASTAGTVLAGTGAIAGQQGLVTPVSSTVGETFNGVATFWLLTPVNAPGTYQVVVTSGGGGSVTTSLGGVFSTAPVSNAVAVSCTVAAAAPAATIRAPSTGQGITPPSTGDAGLADASGGSWTLFVIAGAVAFALAGVMSLRFARR